MPNVVRIPVAAGAFDPSDITLTDDTSGALLIKEGSNEYMRIDTTNGSELTQFKMPFTTGEFKYIQETSAGPYEFIKADATTVRLFPGSTGGGFSFNHMTVSNSGITIASGNEFKIGTALPVSGSGMRAFITQTGQSWTELLTAGSTSKIQRLDGFKMLEVDTDSNTTFTLDDTSGAVFKIVDDAASPNTYLKAVEAGSVSTERNFEIYNSTAPATSVTDGCILFCEDVSSSSELKVRDEAGNVTTLSPHNFSLIPEGASEEMAWSYYSEKNGKKINVDMLRLARLVEQISGEQIIFEEG
jgi:hypothetical protein